MPVTPKEFDDFTRFAAERLSHGDPVPSLEECLRQWRADSEFQETVADVRQSLSGAPRFEEAPDQWASRFGGFRKAGAPPPHPIAIMVVDAAAGWPGLKRFAKRLAVKALPVAPGAGSDKSTTGFECERVFEPGESRHGISFPVRTIAC